MKEAVHLVVFRNTAPQNKTDIATDARCGKPQACALIYTSRRNVLSVSGKLVSE